MSAGPQQSASLSRTAAAEPAAAAASTPTAGSKRRASDVDAQPRPAVDPQSCLSPMDHAVPVGSPPRPSSMVLAAAQPPVHAASIASSVHSASTAASTSKKHRLAPSAVPAAIAPPWCDLCSDALESVFDFVSLEDLTRLMSVSRRWGEAVLTMLPIASRVTIVDEPRLVRLMGMLDSRVRRHVSSLYGSLYGQFWISIQSTLQSISAQTPWLTELCVTLPISNSLDFEAWCDALSCFHKLRAFSVYFLCEDEDGHENEDPDPTAIHACNRVIRIMCELNSTTMHTLALTLPSPHHEISFAPLAALTHLRRFSFDFAGSLALTDAQIGELRALTSVQELNTPFKGVAKTNFLGRMLQPDHALQLTRVQFKYADIFITDPLAAVLGSIPTLTCLDAILACTDLVFLPQLSALTDVGLCGTFPSAALVSALRQCPQITELRLTQFALTGQHLEELLPAFSQLDTVTLESFDRLDSLRCFCTPALAASLICLQLHSLPLCPTTEITHLFGLRRLQFLTISGLAELLTDDQRAELSLHSQRFPQLDFSECDRDDRVFDHEDEDQNDRDIPF